MIILLIKTDGNWAEVFLAKNYEIIEEEKWEAGRTLAESIDKKIQLILKRAELSVSDIDGIGVFSGPGSYTGLRIGHSLANALAYALNISVIGSTGEEWQKNVFERFQLGENDHVAIPFYGAPPRITKPCK